MVSAKISVLVSPERAKPASIAPDMLDDPANRPPCASASGAHTRSRGDRDSTTPSIGGADGTFREGLHRLDDGRGVHGGVAVACPHAAFDQTPPSLTVTVRPAFVVGNVVTDSQIETVHYVSDVSQLIRWSATDDVGVCSYDLYAVPAGAPPRRCSSSPRTPIHVCERGLQRRFRGRVGSDDRLHRHRSRL